MVAREHGVLFSERKAEVVADVPRRVERFHGVAGALDQVAVAQGCSRIEVNIGSVFAQELRIFLGLRLPGLSRLAGVVALLVVIVVVVVLAFADRRRRVGAEPEHRCAGCIG